jgi:hypothetical protein
MNLVGATFIMLLVFTVLAATGSVASGRTAGSAFGALPIARHASASRAAPQMPLPIDLKGKTAFIAGVADSTGYGWAIAKALAEAGCKITVGTWPPVLGIFQKSLSTGKFDEDMILSDGSKMVIEKVYALDAVFDTPEDVPEDIKTNKRYAGQAGYTISEVAKSIAADYGKIDILVHSLANGPEVTKALLETSRKGYVSAPRHCAPPCAAGHRRDELCRAVPSRFVLCSARRPALARLRNLVKERRIGSPSHGALLCCAARPQHC